MADLDDARADSRSPVENILVVSDLHFGEELLPGASIERRHAVELGVAAFVAFVGYHAARRLDGRPWRLVIAGDLFDFMSVVVPSTAALPARSADERAWGVGRGDPAGVVRMAMIAASHDELLHALARFATAGHRVDIVVGNHDVELLAPEVAAELARALADAGADAVARTRITVVPWFVYVPGVAWIEHGHVYDEACSFEFNLAPTDPRDGRLAYNVDYAAVRYLGASAPDLDPHGTEEWGLFGYLRYAWGQGGGSFWRLWAAYARFVRALLGARALHRSSKRRDARRRQHADRLAAAARAGGVSIETAAAIDRLARSPLTVSTRRLAAMLMLDRWGVIGGALLVAIVLLIALPILWGLVGAVAVGAAATWVLRKFGKQLVASQLPMRNVPERIRKLVDAPVVVFGHTHDPRWQPLADGGLYVNSGTWLPATRPGLRRSFTHVSIEPAATAGAPPIVELRQWREGASLPFDAT